MLQGSMVHRLVSILRVSVLVLVLGCISSGIPAGSPEKGYVVWGFVGQGPAYGVTNRPVTLRDAAGRVVQTTRTDDSGRYVLAYHPPGRYVVEVAGRSIAVELRDADQRLDADLRGPRGLLNRW